MSFTMVIGACAAGAAMWGGMAALTGHVIHAPVAVEFGGLAMFGGAVVAGVAFLASVFESSGPWFECYQCHGSYLRHEVEPIAGRGHVCESCLIQRPKEAA